MQRLEPARVPGGQQRPRPRLFPIGREDRGAWLLLLFILVGLVLVAYFDLRTNAVINDEYARRWTIQRFAQGHGLTFWGFSPNLDFMAVALVPAYLGLDPRTWRVVGIPFLAAAAVFVYLSARELGATRFWSAVAAVAYAASPVVLSVGTGIMTETAFIGIEAAAVFFSLRWIRHGTHRWWAVLAIGLLPLQRQQGLVIAGTLALALLLAAPRRRLTRKDLVALAGVAVAATATLALTYWLRRNAITYLGNAVPHFKGLSFDVAFVLYMIAGMCPILGIFGIPFIAALIRRDPADSAPSWAGKLTVPMAIIGVAFGLIVVQTSLHTIFPGDHVSVLGVGPASLGKPELLPRPLTYVLEAVTIVSFVVILVWRRRDWSPRRLGPGERFMVLTAAAQFPLIFIEGLVFDRYFLPILLPVIPMLAVWASSRTSDTRAARAFAVGACLVLLAYFGIGQQDFTEWSNARDRAATVAFAQAASPADVSAGFEEDAEHVWIPAAEHPGSNLPLAVSKQPKVGLETVPLSDPRDGFAYSSIASGKVIIVYASPAP